MEYSEVMNQFIESVISDNMKNNNKSVVMSELLCDYIDKPEENINMASVFYTQTKEKIMAVKLKYQNNLQYPLDQIYDYVISVYKMYEKNEEKEMVLQKIENLNFKKNSVFLGLKSLESDIVKNDSNFRLISKYLKSINSFFERYRILKEIPPGETLRHERLIDFLKNLKNLKKLNVNNMRKYDNMNSLTLKSEYSEDYSELGPQLSDDTNTIMNSKSINRHIESSSLKGNDTLGEIILGLSKEELDKNKMKNAKKIKNKKLQLSNANSEMDLSEGLKPSEKKSNNKIKSWNKEKDREIKPMKSKNSKYNYSIQKYPSTTSPRNLMKTNNNTSTGTNGNGINSLSNTYTTFRTENKPKNYHFAKSNTNISNTMEKVKSQATLLQNDLQKLPHRKLSEDFHNATKAKEIMPRKESTDRLQSPLMYKDKLECTVSLINNGTFSPSTSSQIGNIVFPTNVDQLESVSDEWMTSPLNKIPIRTSKLISEKPVRTRDYKKSLPDYYNLKIDKPILNSTGCCVSCV